MSATPAPASRVHGLTCPECGGTLDVEVGLRVVLCPFCDTSLLAIGGVGIRRWAVEPKIDVEEARRAAMRWLTSGWNRDRRLRREAQQGEALLCFLPFFRVQSECVGFALGTEERRRHVGSGKHRRVETYEVDVERSVEKSFDRTYAALNVAEWGVKRVDVRGDRLVPFRPRSLDRLGMVFPPTGSEADVRAAALEQLKREADPSRGLKTVRFRFLETLRERFSLIYYPLWVIRYRFQGRSYQVLMDGEDGSLVFGKAPGNDLYRAVALVGSEALALFVATTILQMTGVSFGGLVAMGAAVLAVVYWGWRRFRHGGVVIEGSGVEADSAFQELLSGRSVQDVVGSFLENPSRWGAPS